MKISTRQMNGALNLIKSELGHNSFSCEEREHLTKILEGGIAYCLENKVQELEVNDEANAKYLISLFEIQERSRQHLVYGRRR